MNPTEILKDEHLVIVQVLDCLDAMAKRAELGTAGITAARSAIEFFKNFADGCHHAKEEHQLFPLMEARGFSAQSGPTEVMRREHEEGRALIRAMASSLDEIGAGRGNALGSFKDAARAYSALLREHIEKENHCLFPMADSAFTPADQAELTAAFHAVEAQHAESRLHERMLTLAADLAREYRITPRVSEAARSCGCGCNH